MQGKSRWEELRNEPLSIATDGYGMAIPMPVVFGKNHEFAYAADAQHRIDYAYYDEAGMYVEGGKLHESSPAGTCHIDFAACRQPSGDTLRYYDCANG